MLRPWGPCPYHLPPRNQSPWTPLRAPLYPPPPHRESFKKRDFSRVRNVKNTTQVAKFAPSLGPVPYHLPPRHRSPWRPPEPQTWGLGAEVAKFAPSLRPVPLPPTPPEPKPLDPPPRALVPSPTPQGILQNTPFFFFLYALETSKIRRKLRNLLRPWGPCIFLLFVRVRNVKNTTQVAKFAPSLGPVPLPPTPPEPKPLDPPPRALVPSPTPQGILQNTPFFFFLYTLEMSKIRRKLRNLLRPWGPCPYHLPPPEPKPLDPSPRPLVPSPPHRESFKKRDFSCFCRQKYDASCEICSVPGARAPTTYPPRHRSPWRPPEPQTWGLGASGTPCHSFVQPGQL